MTGTFATDHVDVKAWTGRVLGGKYRLEHCIGRSADTLVYRALQLNLRRDVAVKVLFADPKGSMQLGDRMRREARLVAGIRHPGIAEMYDEGVTAEGHPYLVMELLRGQTLEDFIAARGRIEMKEAVGILLQVAAVLGAVHAAGFVHRDIKPSNIFLEQAGSNYTAKLIDFGTARPIPARFAEDVVARKTLGGLGTGTQINTLPGIVFGTPSYMSPEQCRGDEVDFSTDIYSLGVVFYLMLTGSLPFEDVHPLRVMARHLAEECPPLLQKAPNLVELAPLEAVVARALSKDRRARFRSAHELAQAALDLSGVYPRASHAARRAPEAEWRRAPGRSAEPTRPVRRRPHSASGLSSGWIVATTVLSIGTLVSAVVFAGRRLWDADESVTSPPAPAISRDLDARSESPKPIDTQEKSAPSGVLSPTPVSIERPSPRASTDNAIGTASARPTQTAKRKSPEPEKAAPRVSFGLNELMRPGGAQER